MTGFADAARADAVCQALGDPTRRAILARLASRPATISDLAESLSITRTAVGQHLRLLEGCALARTSKVGRTRTCEFDPRGLMLLRDWIDFHRSQWEERLDRLGDILQEEGS